MRGDEVHPVRAPNPVSLTADQRSETERRRAHLEGLLASCRSASWPGGTALIQAIEAALDQLPPEQDDENGRSPHTN